MTGDQLIRQALLLLNYTNHRGEIDRCGSEELFRRGTAIINSVLADVLPIEGKPITALRTLNDELPAEEHTAAAVMPYGVAMLLAQSEGDGTNQQLMASIYNQKRSSIRRPAERVTDCIPSLL